MPEAVVDLLNFSNSNFIRHLPTLLERNFSLQTVIKESKFNISDYYFKERNQYYSTQILQSALLKYSDNYDKILVLTDLDLFVPVLTFVFGEAQLNGKAAVVSAHRLYQEFYGLPHNDTLLNHRMEKEVLHELGHTYGLRHCQNWNCVMHSSLNIDEIDIKPAEFCKICLLKIKEQNH